MRINLSVKLLFAAIYVVGCASTPTMDDMEYSFLEDVRGQEALKWVEAENQRTLNELAKSPNFKKLEAEAVKILEAKDNLPYGTLRDGYIYNFWQDDQNVRGLWRRTTVASYKTGRPKWETLISFDKLQAQDNIPWVYKGVVCQPSPAERCLVKLSPTGKDAVEVREFDLKNKSFVKIGFNAPESKMSLAYEDSDAVLIATNFGEGTLSTSGYPTVVKRWRRGQALSEAEEIFRAPTDHMGVWVESVDTADGRFVGIIDSVSFQVSKTYHVTSGKLNLLPLPDRHEVVGVVKNKALFTIKDAWKGFKEGSLLAQSLDDLSQKPVLVYLPGEKESLNSVGAGDDYVLLEVSKDVRSKMVLVRFNEGKWEQSDVALPEDVEPSLMARPLKGDEVFFTASGFLTPDQILVGSLKENKFRTIYSLPNRFNPKGLVIEQHFAVSIDGTKVPYFVIFSKEKLAKEGSLPTLLYAYGGFEISMTPWYLGSAGKLWLERGGAFAVANIRGGGEYGPKWHQAALKTNRHKAYEDFYAVAEDLHKRGYTTPSQLGIQGGSNGGLLTGVAYTQRPDLFGAVISSVPLLDMLRYHKLLAGASWMDEYGNPDNPKERKYLRSYSPFHNVSPDKTYPPLLLITSTEDDRVHPGHARKMAHRVKDQGHKYFYFENTLGGHSAGADKKQRAKLQALQYTFLEKALKQQ
jgi:prolyl oligopeptidase